MKTAEIIGNNIEKLMMTYNITAIDLSKKIGVTRQTFSNYINGNSTIDSEKLKLIAEYFGKSLDYFFVNEEDHITLMFRATNPKENIDNDSILELEKIIRNYYNLLENHIENVVYTPEQYNLTIQQNSKNISINEPAFDFKIFNYKLPKELEMIIENIAYEQRKKLGVEEVIGSEIIKAIESSGIKVLFKKLNSPHLFGVSAFSNDRGFFILINDSEEITEERKIFSLIHEYAHILLHRECYKTNLIYNDYGNKKNIFEATADAFAGYFLTPRYIVKKYEEILNKRPLLLGDLIILKQRVGVSLGAFTMSIYKYNYITKSMKGQVFEFLEKKGYSKSEPNSILKLEKNIVYNNEIRSSFLNGYINLVQVAELLDIPPNEAITKTQGWKSDNEIVIS